MCLQSSSVEYIYRKLFFKTCTLLCLENIKVFLFFTIKNLSQYLQYVLHLDSIQYYNNFSKKV